MKKYGRAGTSDHGDQDVTDSRKTIHVNVEYINYKKIKAVLPIKITGITSDFNQSIEQNLVDFGINDTLKLGLKYQFQMRQWLIDVTITTNKSVDRFKRVNFALLHNRPLLTTYDYLEIDIVCIMENRENPFSEINFTTQGNNYGIFIMTKEERFDIYGY
jgi:hypothetical protein